jgi:hypothetical protein
VERTVITRPNPTQKEKQQERAHRSQARCERSSAPAVPLLFIRYADAHKTSSVGLAGFPNLPRRNGSPSHQ